MEEKKPHVELVNEAVDNAQAPAANVVVLDEPAQESTFELTASQKTADGETTYAIKFTMPKDKSAKVDYVVGTALSALFRKMELAKAMKTKLFDSRLPLLVSIKSSTHHIDLGRIDEMFVNKLKINNGERSKLSFIERIIAIVNDMGKTFQPIRATELRENARQAVALRYGKQPKGMLTGTSLITIANSELVVDEKGELAEA